MNTATAARSARLTADALEARFGLRVAARLTEANQDLPHDITERLKVARQQALARVPAKVAVKQAATVQTLSVNGGGSATLHLGGMGGSDPASWWMKLGGWLPLLVLLIGIVSIHEWIDREQITAAASIDTALLSDALPPAAYTDPGFDEFLRASDTHADPDPSQSQ